MCARLHAGRGKGKRAAGWRVDARGGGRPGLWRLGRTKCVWGGGAGAWHRPKTPDGVAGVAFMECHVFPQIGMQADGAAREQEGAHRAGPNALERVSLPRHPIPSGGHAHAYMYACMQACRRSYRRLHGLVHGEAVVEAFHNDKRVERGTRRRRGWHVQLGGELYSTRCWGVGGACRFVRSIGENDALHMRMHACMFLHAGCCRLYAASISAPSVLARCLLEACSWRTGDPLCRWQPGGILTPLKSSCIVAVLAAGVLRPRCRSLASRPDVVTGPADRPLLPPILLLLLLLLA